MDVVWLTWKSSYSFKEFSIQFFDLLLVLTILIFLAVSSHCIMGLLCAIMGPELATMDTEWASSMPCCCFMGTDCVYTSFLG